MTDTGSNDNSLAELTEEYLESLRAGRSPSIEDFAQRNPDLADRIQRVFPMLGMMEQVGGELDPPDDAPESPAPKQIGEFRIVREIGRGGMGVVYEAEQLSLGRRVALKILPSSVSIDSSRQKRFQREAHVAAKLHHTNIVPVFETGNEDGIRFIAMQYIRGHSLSAVLRELRNLDTHPAEVDSKQSSSVEQISSDVSPAAANLVLSNDDQRHSEAKPRSPKLTGGSRSATSLPGSTSGLGPTKKGGYYRNVAKLILQAADALDYAHSVGVVHRDVKPSNLLLDMQGRLWVSDFGLARENDSGLTQTGDILGTLRYMAPEQLRGNADQRSDIYGLGLTLYEMLALKPAFDETDNVRIMRQVADTSPAPLRQTDPRLPADLETICLKCAEKEASRRYQSAAELADELRRFLRDEPIRARPVSPFGRLGRWARRNPVVASLTVSLIVALCAGLLGVGIQWRRAEAQRIIAEGNATTALRNEQKAQLQEEATRDALYQARINLLQPMWELGDIKSILAVLENLKPDRSERDRRDFQWYFWWDQCHRHEQLIDFEDAAAAVMDVSAKSGLLGVLTVENYQQRVKLIVMNLDTEEILWSRDDAEFVPTSLDFSTDGQTLAVGGHNGIVRLYSARTGEFRRSLEGHTASVVSVRFSPDDSILAAGSGNGRDYGQLLAWNLETGEKIALASRPKLPHYRRIRFFNDGTGLASTTSNSYAEVFFLSGSRSGTRRSYRPQVRKAQAYASGVPDGQHLITAGTDGVIRVWDLESAEVVHESLAHAGGVLGGDISPDGQWLASSGRDHAIRVWRIDDWTQVGVLSGHSGDVNDVRFLDDSRTLVSNSVDGSVRVWDALKPAVHTLKMESPHITYQVRFTTDGEELIVPSQGKQCRLLSVPELNVSLDVSGDEWVRFSEITATRNSDLLAGVGPEGVLQVINRATGEVAHQASLCKDALQRLATSPSESHVACAGYDGNLYVYDYEAGKPVATLTCHSDKITRVEYSPTGDRLLGVCIDGSVSLWNTQAWSQVWKKQFEHHTYAGAISADGRSIVIGGTRGEMTVLNSTNGSVERKAQFHTGMVSCLKFLHGTSQVLSTSHDTSLKLWDIASGEVSVLHRERGKKLRWVDYHQGTGRIVILTQDGFLRLLNANRP